MASQLNFDAVIQDNSPVAKHLVRCAKCVNSAVIRDLCVSFCTLIFAPVDDESLKFEHERTIRHVQQAMSKIIKECEGK